MSEEVTEPKWKTVGTWILSGLLALLFLGAGGSKLAGAQMHVEHFTKWGYPPWFLLLTGGLELLAALLLLVPRAAFCGAAMLVVIMGGAIFTHAINGESSQAGPPMVLLVLCLVVAYARQPGSGGTGR